MPQENVGKRIICTELRFIHIGDFNTKKTLFYDHDVNIL